TVVAEGPDVMNETVLVGNRLVVTYLVDVQSRIRLYDLAGTPRGDVTLPDVGTVAGLSGRNDGSDVFFAFSSYLRPATVYRYDLRAARLEPFQPVRTPFDATPYETRATFYQSKDGTRVPIFITARKGLARDGSHPTLLYAYGGFDISITPYYSLHSLKVGTCYPATLATTADHDDRVVPGHSFKFAATLQAAQSCDRPVLLRVEKSGSHGYRPTDRVIAEIADEFAFALANLR